jgi:hypothetical protein
MNSVMYYFLRFLKNNNEVRAKVLLRELKSLASQIF